LPRRRRARGFALLGQSYERMGRIEEALRVSQLAQGLYPDDIDILSDLAELLHRSQLDDRARPYYLRVLKIHPNNAMANRGLAEIERS
ncbi:tetratricopeptide repeat protein, partial [Acinetobacter baumannii]